MLLDIYEYFNKLIVEFSKKIDHLTLVMKEQSGWIVLFVGMVAGFAIAYFLLKIRMKYSYRKQSTLLNGTVAEFINERNKAEAILIDLDVGILAYNSNGLLISFNPAVCSILSIKEPPETFKGFLMEYGKENGLQAGFLLGTGSSTAVFQTHDKIVRMRLKEAKLDQGTKAANIVVMQDITEQENEEKRRKEFVANVSHELKTPLTTIKTYSESLLEWGLKEKNKESIRKDVFRIHEDAVRMGTLVEDLLLLSSIDSKGMRPKMDQHDLSSVLRAVVERMQIQAEEKKIELSCYTLAKLPWVFVDRSDIERIMINIISNAIKYTEQNGKVTVYLGVLADDVYVKVTDTGFGIEKEKLPFIFNRFYRVDMTGSRMFGGTGLGLSIAKELVELHGGDITVKSVLGKGTDFVVRIPSARKVFEDALSSWAINTVGSSILYRMASEAVALRAKEIGFDLEISTMLTKNQIEELAFKTAYQDDWDALV